MPHNPEVEGRLGSYSDLYREVADQAEVEAAVEPTAPPDQTSIAEMDAWPTKRPAVRPKHFNRAFCALIRVLAERFNNCDVAYAMDKTKLFTEDQLKTDTSASAKKWDEAKHKYQGMSFEQQFAWRKRAVRKYPAIESIFTTR